MNQKNMSYFCKEICENIDSASIEDIKEAAMFLYTESSKHNRVCELCKRKSPIVTLSEFMICKYCIVYFRKIECADFDCRFNNTIVRLDYKNPSMFWDHDNDPICYACIQEGLYYSPIIIEDNTAEEISLDPLDTSVRDFCLKNLDWAKKYYLGAPRKEYYNAHITFDFDSKFEIFIMENFCDFAKPENFIGISGKNGELTYACEEDEKFDWHEISAYHFIYFLIILKKNGIPRCLRNYIILFIDIGSLIDEYEV